ncbi:MAG: hypothetical protein GX640_21160 [Fibrobacter sp.]|nr:hypothetical protein [Fibrobacter sp.]
MISSDTFSISKESEVNQIYTTIFRSRTFPLIIERSFYSGSVGATSEIRFFTQAGKKACAIESFTNEGGPEEPQYELHFDPKDDKPVIQEITNDTITSQKSISCKKQ